MQAYELLADSPLAKQRVTPNGPNVLLGENTAIGRSAAGAGNLPIDWAQVSGNHCRVFLVNKVNGAYRFGSYIAIWLLTIRMSLSDHQYAMPMLQDPPVYHLEDNSTNGTAINGVRVPKGTSRPLVEGDHIRLAVATQDPNKVIE